MRAAEADARDWLAKAREDLEVVAVTLPRLVAPAAVHVQQAAEKALKAAMVLKGERPPYIHDLLTLRERVADGIAWHPGDAWLARVTTWYVDFRYPLADALWPEPDTAQIAEAGQLVAELIAEAEAKLTLD